MDEYMKVTGTIVSAKIAKGNQVGQVVEFEFDLPTRRDFLAVNASDSSYLRREFMAQETAKYVADSSYIIQHFDEEKFRYEWADKMIKASEK